MRAAGCHCLGGGQGTDSTRISDVCAREIARDRRIGNTVAYGPMLLLNEFDDAGRISGPAVYVMDLGDHNEDLRERFRERRWYRYEVPQGSRDLVPVLVPYDSAP